MDVDLNRWGELRLVEQISEGNRNEVWRGSLNGERVAVRHSRRTLASLDWELDLIHRLQQTELTVPVVVPTVDGRRHHEGVVVQRWLDGHQPGSVSEWKAVAEALGRIHGATADFTQRPGCTVVTGLTAHSLSVDADLGAIPAKVVSELLATFEDFAAAPVAVIHGDPCPSNIRIGPDGSVGLLDFDESRVDVTWLDLSNLGVQVLQDHDHEQSQQLSHAWEASNAWTTEHDYAIGRLESLRALRDR